MPVNSVLLNRYFERHLSRASGASLAGSTLASFLFPPAVTLLLESYGLWGALLLTGGITLHALAGALLLRPPPWADDEDDVDAALTRPKKTVAPSPRRQLENGAGAAVAAASPEEQECLNAAVKMSKVR